MPEMRFKVRWPDETIATCYSPSLVVKEHLNVGQKYPMGDFVNRCRIALNIASERVAQKYGFACSGAMDQLSEIERTAARFAHEPASQVVVVAFED